MDANLHDYRNDNPPEIQLSQPIRHPTNRTNVIGHFGRDYARDYTVATFPRRKDEHWFRGDSTSGLTGYGISQTVLDRLNQKNIDRVLIIEMDNDRVIDFERVLFGDAKLVAYSPGKNESVIGDDSMRVKDDEYPDKQRVLPVDAARQTFQRKDVTIQQ